MYFDLVKVCEFVLRLSGLFRILYATSDDYIYMTSFSGLIPRKGKPIQGIFVANTILNILYRLYIIATGACIYHGIYINIRL